MVRVNITVPDGLLDEIDRAATEIGKTRSAFLQEAGARYIASIDEERERTARAERIGSAMAKMRGVAEHMPAGVDGAEIIRRFREASEPWMRPGGTDADED